MKASVYELCLSILTHIDKTIDSTVFLYNASIPGSRFICTLDVYNTSLAMFKLGYVRVSARIVEWIFHDSALVCPEHVELKNIHLFLPQFALVSVQHLWTVCHQFVLCLWFVTAFAPPSEFSKVIVLPALVALLAICWALLSWVFYSTFIPMTVASWLIFMGCWVLCDWITCWLILILFSFEV